MRIVKGFLIVGLVLAVTAPAVFAQAPVNGVYKSTLGDFLEGRESTSWAAPAGRLMTGNTFNCESWDGASTLGAEWRIYCGSAAVVTLISDDVAGGFGTKTYQIDYSGGYVFFDGAGIWGGGDASYAGVLDYYTELRVLIYVFGAVTGTVENRNFAASLNGYPASCVNYTGNGAWIGDTDGGPKPATYPAFKDAACNAAALGRWGDQIDVTFDFTGCTTPTEEKSWGAIKTLYE